MKVAKSFFSIVLLTILIFTMTFGNWNISFVDARTTGNQATIMLCSDAEKIGEFYTYAIGPVEGATSRNLDLYCAQEGRTVIKTKMEQK